MRRRVLVTGGAGFIGRWAIRELVRRDWEVHMIEPVPVPELQDNGNLHVHTCDLLGDPKTPEIVKSVGATHLLHLAWFTAHGVFWNSEENLRWVSASLDLVRSFAEAGGQRVVGAGSCAEYTWDGSERLREDLPCVPRTLYGTCKLATCSVLGKFAEANDMGFAWGRIFFLYGPREDPRRLIPSLIRPLLAGEKAIVKCGGHVRDLMHVCDVGSAFVRLLETDFDGIVNVAGGRKITLGDIGRCVAELIRAPELLEVRDEPAGEGNPRTVLADVARLRARIDFHPEYGIDEGLRSVIDWYRSDAPSRFAGGG